MDRKTSQQLIRVAMRERHAPGKYDLFAWHEQQEICTLAVRWKTFTTRSVALDTVDGAEGEARVTNAAALPNGVGAHEACYLGSFRVDRSIGREDT
jgi:hypothetical protein